MSSGLDTGLVRSEVAVRSVLETRLVRTGKRRGQRSRERKIEEDREIVKR